ncbi:uncharacterized protein TM35_000084030 [Trypanosoma theileri]|uniref:Uncharacterized protein n=1 Tax=Trypanosoma theileri TaxID=67003 RepID=A0A1X0P133_9TRYP|nr:uncharacterized protein TM35_000084030 [Trypanosoma theileri]ORC90605.1 hypothetical protein TM35_000084030 [Trypanosoma theileri]
MRLYRNPIRRATPHNCYSYSYSYYYYTSSTLSHLCCYYSSSSSTTIPTRQPEEEEEEQEKQKLVDSGISSCDHPNNSSSSLSSTYIGTRLTSYMLSPVFEERHSLWQWRTVVWRDSLHAVPFLLYCAPSVPLRRPFLHNATAECIYTHTGGKRKVNKSLITTNTNTNNNTTTGEKPQQQQERNKGKRNYMEMTVPTPIGALPVIDDTITLWVDKLFYFLEEGEKRMNDITNTHLPHVYTDVFKQPDDGELELPTPPGFNPKLHDSTNMNSTTTNTNNTNNTNNSSNSSSGCDSSIHNEKNKNNNSTNLIYDSPISYSPCSIPVSHRNVIGCGLAEVIVAIDRYAAMLARRDITYAKACWAVLVDSKADVQPYLRCNAVAIEKDLIAGAEAHKAINAAMGDPVRRPLLRLADYPSLAGW